MHHHQRYNTSLRKNAFSVRIAKTWNKLPERLTNAPSLNSFKNRLDKYWKDEELYFNNHKAEITGSHENTRSIVIRNTEDSGEEEP